MHLNNFIVCVCLCACVHTSAHVVCLFLKAGLFIYTYFLWERMCRINSMIRFIHWGIVFLDFVHRELVGTLPLRPLWRQVTIIVNEVLLLGEGSGKGGLARMNSSWGMSKLINFSYSEILLYKSSDWSYGSNCWLLHRKKSQKISMYLIVWRLIQLWYYIICITYNL